MTDLAWEEAGAGPPTILLVHAGIGDRSFWDHVVGPLAEDARVVRYDQRSFGASPDPVGAWCPAEDALSVLDAAGAERAVVIGCSFGSWVALDLAVRRPDRVEALVLVSGPGDEDEALTAQLERVDELMEAGDVDAANELEVELWAGSAPGDVRAWMREGNRRLLERQAALDVEPEFLDPTPDTRAGELDMPVLVLLGERDQPSHILHAREVAEAAGAEVVMVPGAGHLLGRERPEAFVEAVRRFLTAAAT